MTRALFNLMPTPMRSRTVFPSDWRRIDYSKLERIVDELDRGRLFADRAACR
ncbi:MAG: hypothetical protein JWM87_1013 [Candidatus Eremiobacteraeota bacterium]|nr:hypothetical protein [Candidatus Eremiobacteraeota bacterium]